MNIKNHPKRKLHFTPHRSDCPERNIKRKKKENVLQMFTHNVFLSGRFFHFVPSEVAERARKNFRLFNALRFVCCYRTLAFEMYVHDGRKIVCRSHVFQFASVPPFDAVRFGDAMFTNERNTCQSFGECVCKNGIVVAVVGCRRDGVSLPF